LVGRLRSECFEVLDGRLEVVGGVDAEQ